MAELTFEKVSVGGNDFIVLFDDHADTLPSEPERGSRWISALCHRRYGVGADGVLLVKGTHVQHFDPDGSESFCVNGSIGLAFLSAEGFPVPKLFSLCDVPVTLRPARNRPAIRFRPPLVQIQDMTVEGIPGRYVHIGNPHFLVNWDWQNAAEVTEQGRRLVNHEQFPEGANISLWKETADGIQMATFERGVEAVTLSCGSACAALALSLDRRETTLTILPPSNCPVQVTMDRPTGHLALSTEVIHAFQGHTRTLLLDHPVC